MKTLLAISISIILTGGSIFAQSTTAAPAEAKPAKTASFRPVKDQIMKGQAMLKEQKLYAGDATGKYDAATRAAIRSFQKANNLEENGKFDRATLAKMNIALTEKQSGGSGKSGPATKARTLKSGS
ncbi:MAG: peptidoglycan-binding protein, partial [Blastocatellia bacterium]|nr:peptidoglycan-binding protein [Blastocatellia bacterium]